MHRILIIDDDRMLRREVNKALCNEYEVSEASDPELGIAIAIESKPDLILLDVLMPKMDGISVLRSLRREPATSAIPVIMVTSLGADDQVAACIEEGAVDHITKPFSHRMLRARVSSALSKTHFGNLSAQIIQDEERASCNQVVAFLGTKGGVGASTVAANVATVAAQSGQNAILCELRPTAGSLSLQLNASPRDHLGTMINDCELEGFDVNNYLVRDSSGLRILFGPRLADKDVNLDQASMTLIIESLKQNCEALYLDLTAGLTNLNRQILALCNRVVLVLDCELTSVVTAKAVVDELQQTSIRHAIKAIVVKRTPLSIPPPISEIRELLGCDMIGTLPPSADALALAIRTGSTLSVIEPESLMSATVRQLTHDHLLTSNKTAAATN